MSERTKRLMYGQLEEELGREDYQALLLRLQEREGFPRKFRTWAEVVAFMHTTPLRGKDRVLRPILRVHGQDGDSRWRSILLLILWPSLIAIDRQKQHWERDGEERWQAIVSTFLSVIGRVDVEQRRRRYTRKLFHDTVHHLHDQFRLLWTQREKETGMSLLSLDELRAAESPDYAAVDQRDMWETGVRKLRTLMQDKHISEEDFQLLMETRVKGKPLSDYAREVCRDYQEIKKHRQRLEATIRRSLQGASHD